MTLHERVIVSAYTGYLMCDFSHVHKYIEEKMGRPVWTHEMRASNKSFHEELTKRVKPDFLKLCGNETTPRPATEQETHEAVVKLARGELEEHERINCWFRPEFVRALIDRLDAAHKREIEDAERRGNHAATKAICETIEKVGPLYDAESVGNAAKLREVVGDLLYMAERYVKKTPATESVIFDAKTKKEIRTVNYYDVIAKAQAALAAPPRNCDLYADEQSAWEAFSEKRQGPDSSTEEYEHWLFEKATA